jgi:predicted DNA-binding transcriptional regulator AlpA
MSGNIIRKSEVLKRTGLSYPTIFRYERAGLFPHRIRLTESGLIGWYESEIDAWIHERVRGGGKRPSRAGSAL